MHELTRRQLVRFTSRRQSRSRSIPGAQWRECEKKICALFCSFLFFSVLFLFFSVLFSAFFCPFLLLGQRLVRPAALAIPFWPIFKTCSHADGTLTQGLEK